MSNSAPTPASCSPRSVLSHAAVLLLGLAGGCGGSDDPAPLGAYDCRGAGSAPLLLIARGVDEPPPVAARGAALASGGAPAALAAAADEPGFYLAVRRDALGQRWFLSAYLAQYFPGAVDGGAASTLGTRVVRFELQNGRMFVFDADDRHARSDTFDPELLIEAYPLVSRPELLAEARVLADDYVLVDPGAGLNRFGVVGDSFASTDQVAFAVELSFLRNPRCIADGVTFEQVFTGYATEPVGDDPIDRNDLRGAGTLGVAIRAYAESAEFTEVPAPERPHYFLSEPRYVPDTGDTERVAAHWNIHPGMTPIRWYIATQLQARDEELPAYELVRATIDGIEGWNDAFGFQVFEAVLAGPDDSPADDDKNFLVFDADPSAGYAFADWRTNPNTGEIRGASVYLSAAFVCAGCFGDADEARAIPPRLAVPALVWNGLSRERLCELRAADVLARGGPRDDRRLTPAQKTEAYLRHVVAHEIGHVLGLRHNFAGSLSTPATSVMDYLLTDDSIAVDRPSSYDREAVGYLYGRRDELPAEAFCTDEDTRREPSCRRFDTGPDPLDYHDLAFSYVLREYGQGGLGDGDFAGYLDYVEGVLGYVRAGDAAAAAEAWAIVERRAGVPITPLERVANPGIDGAADRVFSRVLYYLFLAPASERAAIRATPSDPSVLAAVRDQILRVLVDEDGARSFASRRLGIDVLVAMQSPEALAALLDGRARLELLLADPELDATTALLIHDLVARIDAATDPYFE